MAADLLASDSSFVQMVIMSQDRKAVPLTLEEAYEIEKYILYKILHEIAGHPKRKFRGEYVFSKKDGAIIINTHVDSVDWLKSVIKNYQKRCLEITNIEDAPQYTAEVKTVVPRLDSATVGKLFDLLEVHNPGLQTGGWRITSIKHDKPQKWHLTLLIDDPGMQILERNGFKLFLGFSTLTFEILCNVKRCEHTGEICVDDIHSKED